jgi:hypothetical protein
VRDFLNAISHKNLVLTHHSATVWVENKPTNRTKPANSFSKIGHYTSVAVCQTKNRNPRRDPATGELMDPVYKLQVMDCTANAPLSGMYELTDENVTFSNLAMAVYPDSEFETWE